MFLTNLRAWLGPFLVKSIRHRDASPDSQCSNPSSTTYELTDLIMQGVLPLPASVSPHVKQGRSQVRHSKCLLLLLFL